MIKILRTLSHYSYDFTFFMYHCGIEYWSCFNIGPLYKFMDIENLSACFLHAFMRLKSECKLPLNLSYVPMDNTTAALFFMLSTHVDRYIAIFINVYCKLLCMCNWLQCV